MIAVRELLRDYIVVSLLAFLTSMLLTPMVRKWCREKHLFDFPTSRRKIHTIPIPTLGGIAIYCGFFLPLFAIFLTTGVVHDLFSQYLDILLSVYFSSSLVFAIGVYDDIRGATVFQKLSVQFIAAILIYFLGFKVDLISIPFIGSVPLGILGLPITILWIVGITNAINFIDGVDGLACGVGFFAVSTMFILSLFLHHALTAFFAAALAGAIFGFGLYNFAPASIFMGDSGSLFIGFTIAVIALHGSQKSSTAVVLLIPIVALGVPIADTLLAIIRRVSTGHSPFTADKDHIHHRLLQLGLSSRQVVLVLYAVCSLLGSIALLMTAVNNGMLALILIVLSIMTIGGMKMLGYTADVIEMNALAKERIQRKKRMLQHQKFVEDILREIANSSHKTTLAENLMKYFHGMGFDVGIMERSANTSFQSSFQICEHVPDLSASAEGQKDDPIDVLWYSPEFIAQGGSSEHLWTISFPLYVNQTLYAKLVIGKKDISSTFLLESPFELEKVQQAIEQSLSRMSLVPSQKI